LDGRDLCQGGHGVALVVGRAGTGKTFALGIARHGQLDGYRLLASAPTGIATLSLQGEGFEDVATCDRLLADLDRGQEQLDARTLLVVDEAGMVGSRKLTRLLEHAHQARAKVVLVGDDRPSGVVRPLSQADLQTILAHLADDPDELLAAPAPIGRWWQCGCKPRWVGRAPPPKPDGGGPGRPSRPPGPRPCPGGSPPSSASVPPAGFSAAWSCPGSA
jgi:hypothetical protein